MTMHPFVHLRVHSEFSIVDSTIRVDRLIQSCVEAAVPAVALTDEMNLFAMVRFYREAVKNGIKPIIGADVWVEKAGSIRGRVTLLVQDRQGLENLFRILSDGWTGERIDRRVCVSEESIYARSKSLIALIGGHQNIWESLSIKDASEQLLRWREVFTNNLILTVERVGRAHENTWIDVALKLATQHQVALTATNEVRFLNGTSEDFDAHQARVGINLNQRLGSEELEGLYTPDQYLKSPGEMNEIFADLPLALSNSWQIARRCNLELVFDKPQLPRFPTQEGQSESQYLTTLAHQGLHKRFAELELDDSRHAFYIERLDRELKVIIDMQFPGYFLIVADFMRWSRQQDIAVGPGRGSGAGSLVAYALGITNIDPIRYNLLFERFLNPERISMPDFDIDFCMERRDEVIDYVVQRYGSDQVAQIITFGTMAAKAAIRDAARVMSLPPVAADRIAKMIPNDLGMTLDKAMEKSQELKSTYARDDEARSVYDLAKSLEGLVRNAGKHAGGVVIAPTEIVRFSPLYMDEASQGGNVTQFDKDDVEAMGLVKFDFLGLRTLTIIQWAMQSISARNPETAPASIDHIELDDPATFDIFKAADTLGVFQCESSGIRMWMHKLQPDCFEDIMALMALFRPGPLGSGMGENFIARKKGEESFEYLHADLENVLKESWGVFLYQEQVMQCAQILADYSLGEADLLRRAMGKKKPAEMKLHEERFIQRAVVKGTDEPLARHIFTLMSDFAEYGFNKSHAAVYALISYQTAWLKAHYMVDFYTAVINSEIDNHDRIRALVKDAAQHDIKVIAPDINCSNVRFSLNEGGNILWGLAALKGFGSGAAEGVVEARDAGGPFASLFDFCQRVEINKVGKKGLEILALSGAMDCWGVDRASLMATIPMAFQQAEQHRSDIQTGQNVLFGSIDEAQQPVEYVSVVSMDPLEKLRKEKALTGVYHGGHPLDYFEADLALCGMQPLQPTISNLKKRRRSEEFG